MVARVGRPLRFPFRSLGEPMPSVLRPVLPVEVGGLHRAPHAGLLDTGSLHNRFGAFVARAAGIELADAPVEVIALGGFRTQARRASVELSIGEATWTAPVWFCDPWPLGFHLLGLKGFFDHFAVTIRAARYEIELTQEPAAGLS
ncbi:hypothetical protein BH23ACT1_BH23ACT1_04110 [soil metagenome]